MVSLKKIKSVVFSGGGNRCIWQIGFWEAVSKNSDFKPEIIAAVSAGATMACITLSGKAEEGLGYFKRVFEKNSKNMYLSNIFLKKPVFPQHGIYKKGVMDIIGSKDIERLHAGPEIRVLISQPPRWLGPRSATVVGLAAYSMGKKLNHPMHTTFPSKLGFTPLVVSINDCSTPEELTDLLLQSSCTPPFVPVLWRNGTPTLDGGLIDNVPICALPEENGEILVLLTRQYPDEKIPGIPGRTYVQPSVSIKIDKWDFTNPEELQKTFDLGRRDGERFAAGY